MVEGHRPGGELVLAEDERRLRCQEVGKLDPNVAILLPHRVILPLQLLCGVCPVLLHPLIQLLLSSWTRGNIGQWCMGGAGRTRRWAGNGKHLIFSGGVGKLTAGRFPKFEAEVFADIARQMGVPVSKILVEGDSTNTGENVCFTHKLLQQKGLRPRSLILVQKPYMERRTYATFSKQWPDSDTEFTVTSPQLDFASYPNGENPRELVINIMVGDLVRIRDYPARGFQIEQDIPDEVWEAGQRLIASGYSSHLP